MPLRPIDVRGKEFRNGFRGYDPNQVDDFLDGVADEFERNYTENQRMREEVSSLRDRLQQFEDLEGSIRATLVHAERASDDLRRAASQEAEGIKQSAQREADFTIREAQSRSHQMLADSSARVERAQDSYEALQEAKRSFANDFRHLLKTYADMMENMEVASAREIEASLRERLDTESIAVVREAAQEEAMVAEEAGELEGQNEIPVADEQPRQVIRDVDPLAAEPRTEEPPAEDPEVVEPSTAQGESEEPSLAEESSSQEFFDREQVEHLDGRIFRASRFLRRRE